MLKNNMASEYKQLRGYIKEVVNTTATLIEATISEIIGLDEKSVQRVSAGNRNLRWGEAKSTAKYLIDTYGNRSGINPVIFRELLRGFLLASATLNPESGIEADMVDKFLVDNLGTPTAIDVQNQRQYSNLSSRGANMLIRQNIIDDIENGVTQDKIIFMDGFTGAGKSRAAMYYAKYCLQEYPDIYSGAIWNRDTDGNLTLMGVVNEILTTFDHPNLGNMNSNDKIQAALKHLNTHRSIIIIDNFESIDANEKDEILRFLIDRVSSNTVAIITCKNRMITYKLIKQNIERFHEVTVKELEWDQWIQLAKALQKSSVDINVAVTANPDLLKFVYDLCEGNIYGLLHLIATISSKIGVGEEFSEIKKGYTLRDLDKESHDWIVKKSIKELSDNDKCVLVALCLFAVPATKKDVSKVSGLNGLDENGVYQESSALRHSIENLRSQFLVEEVHTQIATRFTLPPLLRPILFGELKQDNYKEHAHIIENWIRHYSNLAKTIGFCFNDFGKLKVLDSDKSAKEIHNLVAVLDFCYDHQRWENYYDISENTKYYFYTRGISGTGKQSVHCKRAYAARKLGNGINEFNSLLYHCNVACKAKEWDGINECFKRIDMLIQTLSTIPQNDLMKYEYVKALYALGKNEYESAKEHFEAYGEMCKPLFSDTKQPSELVRHDYIANLRWHSVCLYNLAMLDAIKADEYATQAFDLLKKAVEQARPLNFERAIVHSILLEIHLYVDVKKDMVAAIEAFHRLDEYRETVENDIVYKTEHAELQSTLTAEGRTTS